MLFAATAISYVDRQVMTVLAPTLRDQLGLSNTGYASILTAFLLAYTFMQPVTGWLIDRVGARITMKLEIQDDGGALATLRHENTGNAGYIGKDRFRELPEAQRRAAGTRPRSPRSAARSAYA